MSQVGKYFIAVHKLAIDLGADDLAPVIAPWDSRFVNGFCDYAHRLGFNKARRFIGDLRGKRVLDVGCGRGRWVTQFIKSGCSVTGLDISSDVVVLLQKKFPTHSFIAGDLANHRIPKEGFDLVSSITVLQHLPKLDQAEALKNIYSALKPGGRFLLLEGSVFSDGPVSFARSREDWKELAEAVGFRCVMMAASNYEVPFVLYQNLHRMMSAQGKAVKSLELSVEMHQPRTIGNVIRTLLALFSYPIEWIMNRLEVKQGTHFVGVFQK